MVPEEAKIVDEEDAGVWRRTEVKVAKSKKLRQLELDCRGVVFLDTKVARNIVMDDINHKDKNINTIKIGTTEKEKDYKKNTIQNISAQGKNGGKEEKSKILLKKFQTGKIGKKESQLAISGEKQQSYILDTKIQSC